MKKIFLFIVPMLLAATAARAFDFRAAAPTGQWLYYEVIAGTSNVKVVNPDWDTHSSPEGALQIPSTVSNEGATYTVTEIDARAFMSCDVMTGVVVPESVQTIGSLAFAFCTSLASIELPEGLTQIGIGAFSDCAYYTDASNWQADGMLYIGPYVVRARPSATGTLTVAAGATGTADGAFENCNQVERIVLPESMAMIGGIAFQNCLSMDTLEILSTVPPTLGANAFITLEEFAVLVPCHSGDTYASATGWSGRNIVEDCDTGTVVGIATVEAPSVSATVAEGGVVIDGAEGRLVTVSDMMGRRVSESRGGYVPLPSRGIYVVGVEGMKAIKIVY